MLIWQPPAFQWKEIGDSLLVSYNHHMDREEVSKLTDILSTTKNTKQSQ